MNKINNYHYQNSPGWGLIDAILSVGIIAIVGLLVVSLSSVSQANTHALRKMQAAALADEQLNAIKRLGFDLLTDQTDGAAVNLISNAGNWSIVTDPTSLDTVHNPCPPATISFHCGTNVIRLAGDTSFSGLPSGRLLFPDDVYADTTFQANWKIISGSPANWIIGYYFRARDLNNGYRLRISSPSVDLGSPGGIQNVVLEKLVNGTTTNLYTSPGIITFPIDTWITIRVVMSGNTLSIYKNGTLLTGATINDTSFAAGIIALAGWNGVSAEIDDVTAVDPGACGVSTDSCWNFEVESALPIAWTRFGANDLPDATPTIFDDNLRVTIAAYPSGSTDLKQATITVNWIESGRLQTYTTSGFIQRNGIGS